MQILEQQPDLFRHIRDEYISSGKQRSVTMLKDWLFNLYKQSTHKVGLILLIDALDELEDPVRDLVALLEDLIKIARENSQRLRICVSGRSVHKIFPWLNQYLCIVLENHTSLDITIYVQAKTLRIITDHDAKVYKDFQQDVIDKAKGVFLWVVLVIEELLDGWEDSEPIVSLRGKLASLPVRVEEFFGRMLQKIAPDQVAEATAMFKCVLGYLLRACIQYLCAPELKNIPISTSWLFKPEKGRSNEEIFKDFHFLSYSLRNWVDHYLFAEQDGSSQSRQIQDFAESKNDHFLTWYQLYCHCFALGWDGDSSSFLSFVAEHNLYGYVKDRLEMSKLKNTDGSEFDGLVQAAVVGNSQAMVRLLLDNGIDVNTVGGRFGTAIAAAIIFKNREMVSLLKEYGAQVELHSPGSPLNSGSKRWTNHKNAFSRARAIKSEMSENSIMTDANRDNSERDSFADPAFGDAIVINEMMIHPPTLSLTALAVGVLLETIFTVPLATARDSVDA
ncbi:MAG: hypothetical protein Q9167_002343 [Letrouitia subvulpina]